MGLKEGYKAGYRVAQTVFDISQDYVDVHDPGIMKELQRKGIDRADINKLAIFATLSPEQIGYTAAGIVFILSHGTIWNSKDMH